MKDIICKKNNRIVYDGYSDNTDVIFFGKKDYPYMLLIEVIGKNNSQFTRTIVSIGEVTLNSILDNQYNILLEIPSNHDVSINLISSKIKRITIEPLKANK